MSTLGTAQRYPEGNGFQGQSRRRDARKPGPRSFRKPGKAISPRVPALNLAGVPGTKLRVDAINRIGPTDAWFTLDTVTLTNTTQLYFDVSAPSEPERLYRIEPVP